MPASLTWSMAMKAAPTTSRRVARTAARSVAAGTVNCRGIWRNVPKLWRISPTILRFGITTREWSGWTSTVEKRLVKMMLRPATRGPATRGAIWKPNLSRATSSVNAKITSLIARPIRARSGGSRRRSWSARSASAPSQRAATRPTAMMTRAPSSWNPERMTRSTLRSCGSMAALLAVKVEAQSHPADAIGLGRLVAAGADERPEHPPGAAGREEPVRLAAERPPELRLQGRPRDRHGPRKPGREALDELLGHDAA